MHRCSICIAEKTGNMVYQAKKQQKNIFDELSSGRYNGYWKML